MIKTTLTAPQLFTHLTTPVECPEWWEGHIICYKVYPDGPHGRQTLNLCSRDGGEQCEPPVMPGDRIHVRVGETIIAATVTRVDIDRPGWKDTHDDPNDPFADLLPTHENPDYHDPEDESMRAMWIINFAIC